MVDFEKLRNQAKQPRKFSDVVDNKELFPDTELLSDYENQELIFMGVEFRTSKTYGEFATITAIPLEEDVTLMLRTTSQFILRQLHELVNQSAFPVQTMCVKEGKAWMLK